MGVPAWEKGHNTVWQPRETPLGFTHWAWTAHPCEPACWTLSPSRQLWWDDVVTRGQNARCLRNLWNNNLHKFHPVEIVVSLFPFSPSCSREITSYVPFAVTLVGTGLSMEYFLFPTPSIFPIPISLSLLFPPFLLTQQQGFTPFEDEWKRWSSYPLYKHLWASMKCWHQLLTYCFVVKWSLGLLQITCRIR